jgi:hypothetical protein
LGFGTFGDKLYGSPKVKKFNTKQTTDCDTGCSAGCKESCSGDSSAKTSNDFVNSILKQRMGCDANYTGGLRGVLRVCVKILPTRHVRAVMAINVEFS